MYTIFSGSVRVHPKTGNMTNGVTLRSRRFHVQLKKSAQLRAGGDGVADHYQIQLFLALLRVDGGQ